MYVCMYVGVHKYILKEKTISTMDIYSNLLQMKYTGNVARLYKMIIYI